MNLIICKWSHWVLKFPYYPLRAYLYWTGILWFLLLFFNCSRRQNVKFAIYDVKIGIYFITQWLVAHQNKYLEYEPFSNVILLLFTNIKICQKSFLTLLIVEGCFGIKEVTKWQEINHKFKLYLDLFSLTSECELSETRCMLLFCK